MNVAPKMLANSNQKAAYFLDRFLYRFVNHFDLQNGAEMQPKGFQTRYPTLRAAQTTPGHPQPTLHTPQNLPWTPGSWPGGRPRAPPDTPPGRAGRHPRTLQQAPPEGPGTVSVQTFTSKTLRFGLENRIQNLTRFLVAFWHPKWSPKLTKMTPKINQKVVCDSTSFSFLFPSVSTCVLLGVPSARPSI
mgnify:CR=1 FL=1